MTASGRKRSPTGARLTAAGASTKEMLRLAPESLVSPFRRSSQVNRVCNLESLPAVVGVQNGVGRATEQGDPG